MSKNEKPSPGRLAIGAVMGAAVTLTLSTLFVLFIALPVASGVIGEGSAKAVVAACAFVSAAVGAMIARLKNRGAALISGVGAALIAILARLLIGIISGGPHAFDSADTAVSLAILCGGIASGAVTFRRRRRKR